MEPTYAVTAATGAFGRLAVAGLVARGLPVVAVARDPAKAADLEGAEVRIASYDDPAALATALEGIDRLLLVSGTDLGKRAQQHGNVIDAAKAAGVSRLLYTSAPRADTSPLALAPEHWATEQLVHASGIPFTIARNNWYHENYLAQLAPVRATGTLIGSAGSGRVASASRADLAAGAVEALVAGGHEGATYELGGDVAWTLPELAATLAELLGIPVAYEDVSAPEHIAALEAAGLPAPTAAFVAGLDAAISDGALDGVTGELARLLGRPTTPLAEALAAGA